MLCKREAKHIEEIQKNTAWLDVVDLLLLARTEAPSTDIHIAVDLPVSQPLVRSNLRDYLSGVCPSLSANSDILEKPSEVEDNWTFIACKASFEFSFDLANHWVPALVKNECSEAVYDSVINLQDVRIEQSISSTLKALADHPAPDAEMKLEDALALQVQETSLEAEYQTATRCKAFVERCRLQGMTPIMSPADGNCLLWSWKMLQDEDWAAEKTDPSQANMKVIHGLRRKICQAWKLGKMNHELQELYYHIFVKDQPPDEDAPQGVKTQPPATPKKMKRCFPDAEVIDLDTPPSKPAAPKRVKDSAPAPAWRQPRKVDGQLSLGPQDKPSESNEPEAKTDWQAGDASADDKSDTGEAVPEVDEMKIDKEDVEEGSIHEEPEAKRRRVGRRRVKNEAQLKAQRLRQYLSHIQADYDTWRMAHWRQTGSKKAGACAGGKFTAFQTILLDGQADRIECPACKGLLEQKGYSEEAFDNFVPDDSAERKDDDIEGEKVTEEEAPKNAKDADGNLDELALDAMVKKISPYLEAMDIQGV